MEIQELTLQTNNLSETIDFYKRKIGFKIISETETTVHFKVGTSILIFELVDSKVNPTYHFAFNIPSNRIHESVEWIRKRTDLIKKDNCYITDFENWKAKGIYFYDNNENLLEFICREDLQNPSEHNFSVESILNISEIGIATEHPAVIGNDIIKKINNNFFVKQAKRDDFVAIGADSGLFVITTTTRNWYPTNRRAEKHRIKTKVKFNNKDFELEFN